MTVNMVRSTDDLVKIGTMLVSVSDRSGLDSLVPGLLEVNPALEIFATGGTFTTLNEVLGAEAKGRLALVSDYTGQPETQGGLVKTLDFKIYLGLLTERYNDAHQEDLARTGAKPIDMVVANLYPFTEAIDGSSSTCETARANIDIGGPCMIRAAAKNYLRVAAVVNPADYPELLAAAQAGAGSLSLEQRFCLAQKAFVHTANYERSIAGYLEKQDPAGIDRLYDLVTAERRP